MTMASSAGRNGASDRAVPPVAFLHICQNVAEHNRLSGLKQLFGASFGAGMNIGINEEFDIGIR